MSRLSYTGAFGDEWAAREERAARLEAAYPDRSRFAEMPEVKEDEPINIQEDG